MTKIFYFWEAPPHVAMPAYLQLRIETWRLACPDAEIVPVNHSNLADLSGGRVDVRKLSYFTYPLQSDVAAIAVLSQQPGHFLDVDTVLLPHFSISQYDPEKLTMYGGSIEDGNHCTGFFCSFKPENQLLGTWLAKANARLDLQTGALSRLRWMLRRQFKGKAAKVPWNYLGNGIVDDLLKRDDYSEVLDLRGLEESGAYPTSRLLRAHHEFKTYQDLWFDTRVPVSEVVQACHDGFVILQNSWNPESYNSASRKEILAGQSLTSRLIKATLQQ